MNRYHAHRHPIRAILGIAIAGVLLFAAAGTVAAHEVSQIEVRCDRDVIHVEGIKFAQELPRVVTVTGPGYSESYTVTTDEWKHNFPLGPNGSYSVDWPDSGDFGPVPFLVNCAAAEPTPRPTPSVSGHTPRPSIVPRPTPPQTDSYTVDARPMFSWGDLLVFGLIFLAITGLIDRATRARRR